MNPPFVLPVPPPVPVDAAPVVATRLVGRALVEAAWSGCWFDGVAKGATLGVVGLIALNLVVLNVAAFVLLLRRRDPPP